MVTIISLLGQYWYIAVGLFALAAIVDLFLVPEKEFDPSLKRWEKRK